MSIAAPNHGAMPIVRKLLTITRIAQWLNHGEGGYKEALLRLATASEAGIPYPTAAER